MEGEQRWKETYGCGSRLEERRPTRTVHPPPLQSCLWQHAQLLLSAKIALKWLASLQPTLRTNKPLHVVTQPCRGISSSQGTDRRTDGVRPRGSPAALRAQPPQTGAAPKPVRDAGSAPGLRQVARFQEDVLAPLCPRAAPSLLRGVQQCSTRESVPA